MSEFPNSTPQINDLVNAVNGPEGLTQMREAMKALLAGTTEQAAPAPRPVLSASAPAPTHMRRFYVGNNAFELYGTSDADLKEQEAAIRELYNRSTR